MRRSIEIIPRLRTINLLLVITNLIIISILVIIHIHLKQYAFDDAYIHFRVARNFFETGYPYYNVNEILKVSTSSGWIIFLTTLFRIVNLFKVENNFPLLISITNSLILFCGLFIYSRILEILLKNQLSTSQKFLFQISFLALLLPSSIGLMETPLALFVTGLGIYYLLNSKPSGFTLIGIAAYIRPEILILLSLTGIFIIIKKQFRFHQILGYSLLGLTPFVLFDLYFYGTVIPHSIIAKSIIYSITPLDPFAKIILFSLPTSPNLNNQISLNITVIVFLCIVILTTLVACKERKNLNSFWPFLFCLLCLGIICVYIIGHVLIFGWYVPLYILPILIASFLCSFMIEHPRNLITKIPLIIFFLLSTISIIRLIYGCVINPSVIIFFESGSRVKTYQTIGQTLYDEFPNATLLTSEIGGLGYSFKGKILDAAGLASSDALEYHPMKVPEQRAHGDIGAIPPEYVKITMPDIIVSLDIFSQALINDDIINQYQLILIPAFLPEDAIYSKSNTIWGSKLLRVYIHKSLPITKKIYDLGQKR